MDLCWQNNVSAFFPKDRHPVGAAEGCGPRVRALGLRGAGNHVFRPLLAQSQSSPTWRSQEGLVFVSRFIIAFLPRSKYLLISWLQSLSEVILEPKKSAADRETYQ